MDTFDSKLDLELNLETYGAIPFSALRRWDRRVLIPYFIARETRNQQILLSEHDAPKRAISWLAYFKSYE